MIMTTPETSNRVKNSKRRQVQLNKNHNTHHYHFRYSRTSWLSLDSTRSDYCSSSVAHILLIVVVLSVQLPSIFYSTCCSTFSSSPVPVVLLPVLGFTTNFNYLSSISSSNTKNLVPFGTRTMGGVASSPSATKSSSESGSHLPRMASSDVSSSGGGTTSVIEKQEVGTLNEKDEQHIVDSSGAPTNIIVHSFHEEPKSIQTLIHEAKSLYESTFTQQDDTTTKTTTCTVAPGRVNLIGEHVDYTGGYVLPLAIEYSTVCYGSGTLLSSDSPTNNNKVVKLNLVSTMDPTNVATLELNVDMANKELPLMPSKERHLRWTNYITGVVAQYIDIFFQDNKEANVLELTLSFCSNVPLGGGLSSSASLEVAVALWLENNFGLSKPTSNYQVNPVDRALKCQKAEHTYANTPCGIMDQYIISAGQLNSLLKIDCQDNTFESISMPSSSSDEICFVVTNSQVKHDNAGGEYPIRVKQCQDVKTIIEDSIGHTVPNLRHVTMNMIKTALEEGKFPNGKDDVLYKRVHHVITENERVLECSKALQDGDWNKVGKLMTESHRSMQYDYETSCEEIDFLVDTALQFQSSSSSSSSKIYGTRLTGGGFGGCTVTLLPKDDANEFIAFLKQQYNTKYNQDCISFITTPACGVHVVDISTLTN